jgi:hypothetical protein
MHRTFPFRPWQQARSTAAAGRPRSVGQVLMSVRMSTVPARQRSDPEMSARAGSGSTLTQERTRIAPDSHRGPLTPPLRCCMADTATPEASVSECPTQRPRWHALRVGTTGGRRRCRGRDTSPQMAWIEGNPLRVSTMTRRLRVQRACRVCRGQVPTSCMGRTPARRGEPPKPACKNWNQEGSFQPGRLIRRARPCE